MMSFRQCDTTISDLLCSQRTLTVVLHTMFPVAGIESLSGGATSEPYKGKHGQKRWEKMRENVIKEWEAEQCT
jgi:hypothetical protein